MQNGRHEQNVHSKFRDLHITGKQPLSEDGATKANTLMQGWKKPRFFAIFFIGF